MIHIYIYTYIHIHIYIYIYVSHGRSWKLVLLKQSTNKSMCVDLCTFEMIFYQILGPSTCYKYVAPSTWFPDESLVACTLYQVLSPSPWCQVIGAKHLVPGIWYQVLCTK